MKNEKFYEVARPRSLTINITRTRWKLLGQVLRLSENKPVRTAIKYLFMRPSASVINLEAGKDQRLSQL